MVSANSVQRFAAKRCWRFETQNFKLKNKVNMEHGNLNCSENANSDLGAVMRSVVWKPSPLIRWKRVEIEKVLQQLWQGDMGEQEWRDVPEED